MNSLSSIGSIVSASSSSSGGTPNVGGERFVFLFETDAPTKNSATGYTSETATTFFINGVFILNSTEYFNNPNSLNIIQGPNNNQGSGRVGFLTPAFNMSTATGFTFSCWLKITGTIYNSNASDSNSGYPLLFAYNQIGGGDLQFSVYIRNNNGALQFNIDTGNMKNTSSVTNCKNSFDTSFSNFTNWANVVFTITDIGGGVGEIKLYINNSLIGTGANQCNFSQGIVRSITSFNFTAGSNNTTVSGMGVLSYSSFVFNKTYPAVTAYMDNARIFLKTITAAERASIYNNRL